MATENFTRREEQGGATENLDQGRADIFDIARDAEAGVKCRGY